MGENGKKGDNQGNLSCLSSPCLKQKISDVKFGCEGFEPGYQVLPELVQARDWRAETCISNAPLGIFPDS